MAKFGLITALWNLYWNIYVVNYGTLLSGGQQFKK